MTTEPTYYVNPKVSGQVGFLCSQERCKLSEPDDGDVIIEARQVDPDIRKQGAQWNVMHIHQMTDKG